MKITVSSVQFHAWAPTKYLSSISLRPDMIFGRDRTQAFSVALRNLTVATGCTRSLMHRCQLAQVRPTVLA